MASVDGLVSGLNTSDIIAQLMQLERQPQARLQARQGTVESAMSALRNLNTKFLAITTAADKMMKPAGWQLAAATSSDPTRVAVTATAGASQGSLSFSVSQLAAAGSYLSAGSVASTTAADSVVAANTTFELTKGTSAPVTIDTGDGSLGAVVAAINNAGAGVTASAVQTATGEYRLQLTSTTTGSASGIAITTQSTETNTFLSALNTIAAPQDAVLVLGGGTPLADGSNTVVRSSNTISDLMTGVTLTLTKPDPNVLVTIGVKSDTEALAAQVAGLVDAINTAGSDIRAVTNYNVESKAKGKLYGDGTIRGLRDKLAGAVVGGGATSAGLAGVSIGRDGTVVFDKATFLKALETDPAAVEAALGKDGLSGRVHALADSASRSKTSAAGPGIIAGAITARESQVRTIKSDISNWDNRLELKERTLARKFAALEKALGASQSQGQWLAGQIAGLPSWGG